MTVLEAACLLFAHLENCGLDYAVVGDHREYDKDISSDIDIVVHQQSVGLVFGVLSEFCDKHGLSLIQCFQHESSCWYYVIAWSDNSRVSFLCPDISGDYKRNQRLFLSSEEMLENSTRAVDSNGNELGFQIPEPANAFIYYLIKKIDKGQLADSHGDYLSSQWHLDPVAARVQVARWWGDHELALCCCRER
jgi:hypothetical protein